jgi:hypothetical protein
MHACGAESTDSRITICLRRSQEKRARRQENDALIAIEHPDILLACQETPVPATRRRPPAEHRPQIR